MTGLTPYNKNESLNQMQTKRRYGAFVGTLNGSATLASITTSTDVGAAGAKIYCETVSGVQPTITEDTGANFATLDSEAAPAIVGVLVRCADAKAMVAKPRITVVSSASMTAGVTTLAGASTSGVTASKNLAFTISCTGLDLDAGTATHTFLVEYWYDAE